MTQFLNSTILIVGLALIPSLIYADDNNKTYHQISLNAGLRFTENKGQIIDSKGFSRNDIKFIGDIGTGLKIYFQKGKISYVISKKIEDTQLLNDVQKSDTSCFFANPLNEFSNIQSHRVDLEFENANLNAIISPGKQAKDYSRYYLLLSIAPLSVSSSANSISPPVGMPRPRRVIFSAESLSS